MPGRLGSAICRSSGGCAFVEVATLTNESAFAPAEETGEYS